MKQVWKIDQEFKRLSVPLSPEEENRLENSLLREGCREPIVVWHGCILPQIRKPCGDPYASRGRVHRAERRIIRSNGRTMWLSGNKGVD